MRFVTEDESSADPEDTVTTVISVPTISALLDELMVKLLVGLSAASNQVARAWPGINPIGLFARK